MVTATLPPFARSGQQIDVTVSSMGNAKSVRGGTLLMTRSVYHRYWNDRGISGIAVYTTAGADVQVVAAALRTALGGSRRRTAAATEDEMAKG